MTSENCVSLILMCLLTMSSFAQSESSLEIYQEKFVELNPTMVKDSSLLNYQSELTGYKLVLVSISPCNGSLRGESIKERIARREFNNDTLSIDVAITANCCSSFIGEIQIKEDTILNIVYSEYGGECMCSCCFQLTYQIVTIKNDLSSFQLNGKPIIETDQVYRVPLSEIEYHDNGNVKTETYKLDDELIYVRHHNDEGEIIKTDYYRDGVIVSQKTE